MKVMLSKSRKAVYYSRIPGRLRKTKIPRRLENNATDIEGYLIDDKGERIAANIRTAGTPKYLSINNQHIYAGNYITRLQIVNGLKEFLLPYVQQLPKIEELPLIIDCELFTPQGTANWDIENFGVIYSKVFNDLLVREEKIPDDSVKFITQPGSGPKFTPVESMEDRKIVYTFYQDLRQDIQQLKLWET